MQGLDPLMTERYYKGSAADNEFWFKAVHQPGLSGFEEWEYSIEWFFPKSVPKELKKKQDEIIAHCKQILL